MFTMKRSFGHRGVESLGVAAVVALVMLGMPRSLPAQTPQQDTTQAAVVAPVGSPVVFRGDTVTISVDGDQWVKSLKHACFSETKRKLLWMQKGGDKGIEIDDIKVTEFTAPGAVPAAKPQPGHADGSCSLPRWRRIRCPRMIDDVFSNSSD